MRQHVLIIGPDRAVKAMRHHPQGIKSIAACAGPRRAGALFYLWVQARSAPIELATCLVRAYQVNNGCAPVCAGGLG